MYIYTYYTREKLHDLNMDFEARVSTRSDWLASSEYIC